MNIPITLSVYIGKRFIISTSIIFATLVLIIFLFDFIELMRKGVAREVPLGVIIKMGLLRLPSIVQKIMPFAVLLGGVLAFTRLTATTELIVTRSAGVSAWQFLMPAFAVAMVLGIFMVTVFSPIAATMLSKFEQVEAKYFKGATSMLSVSSTGLWLKQKNINSQNGKTIINALRVSHETMELFDITIFMYDKKDRFMQRLDAQKMKLENGYWDIKNALLTVPGKPVAGRSDYNLKTNLRSDQIQESFSAPETISFWELPGFIKTLKKAGFSALRHRLHWHSVLSTPFFLCAMVFFAAAFSLRPPRQGRMWLVMSGGIISGFLIYFLSGIVAAIGISGSIPVIMAAWAPVGISIMLGAALMLHLEDG